MSKTVPVLKGRESVKVPARKSGRLRLHPYLVFVFLLPAPQSRGESHFLPPLWREPQALRDLF
ncbi:hypothetical protein CBOM_05021 [Ceraceosorus bombacis]|uniref:Uncharacterized protein n=1 Tax=Ceraceosorus bombacis TaxID=401625 RepID=A0A0P1BIU0_9BASI|nr:hypothetical protein CBOM_05021 [Ceraceosorus bombacis]